MMQKGTLKYQVFGPVSELTIENMNLKHKFATFCLGWQKGKKKISPV